MGGFQYVKRSDMRGAFDTLQVQVAIIDCSPLSYKHATGMFV